MNIFIPKRSERRVDKKNFQPFNSDLQQMIRRKYKLWNSFTFYCFTFVFYSVFFFLFLFMLCAAFNCEINYI